MAGSLRYASMQGMRLGQNESRCSELRFLHVLDPGKVMSCIMWAVSGRHAAGHGAVPAALECNNHSRGPARPATVINSTRSMFGSYSVVVSTSSAVLSGKVDLWMHNALEPKSVCLLNACAVRCGRLPCDVSVHRCGRRSFLPHTVRSELFACAHCGSCPRAG